MADNYNFTEGTGKTASADDIGSVLHPRIKIEWGADGTANETDDATGKRVPVKVGEELPAGTQNIGDVDIASLPNEGQQTMANSISVAIASNQSSVPVTAVSAGDVANDSTDSGNPVKVGGQARTTNPTAVADGDRVNGIFDKLGKQVVVGSIRDLKGVQQTTITASTSETTIVTAVASTFLDLYGLILSNTSATATNVTIKDATSGTTRVIIAVPAGDTRGFMLTESAAIPQSAVNNNWTATSSASITSLQVTALFVKNI